MHDANMKKICRDYKINMSIAGPDKFDDEKEDLSKIPQPFKDKILSIASSNTIYYKYKKDRREVMDVSLMKGIDYAKKRDELLDKIKTKGKFLVEGEKALNYLEIKNLAKWSIYRSPLLDAKPGTLDYKSLKKLIAEDRKKRGKPYKKSELEFDRVAEEREIERRNREAVFV